MVKFGIKTNKDAFLRKIEENDYNEVKFTVSFSYCSEKPTEADIEDNVLKTILKNTVPLYPDDNNTYEIVFDHYILYQTRNESYCSRDDYEIRKGDSFILFEKSRLLDMLPQITDCYMSNDGIYYPGEWKHYGIYCLNHIIDIISCNEPIIRKISWNED